MLIICCPVCGVAGDEEEFHYGGEGHIRRPASHDTSVSDEAQRDYLYIRENPRGLLRERWLHQRGCGKWFHAVRDTVNQEILLVYPITDPPADLEKLEAERARRETT